ncbi:hypothetical protein [Thermomonas sp.]|uniref:hypothetical protein n=1 Tax=Thermomonas sp. TaxID=1971895 RepID=UPI00391B64CA
MESTVLPAEFSPKAMFGVMPDGSLAWEDDHVARSFPSGKVLPGMLFREEADLIPKDEFMRRIAESQTGP